MAVKGQTSKPIEMAKQKKKEEDAQQLGQQTVPDFFKVFSNAQKQELNSLFAMAVYTSGASFSFFETPEWVAFFKRLGYTPPSRQTLSDTHQKDTLLDKAYSRTKASVQSHLDAAPYIGIVCDESNNVTKERIENTSVVVNGTAFYWSSEDSGSSALNADHTVQLVRKKAVEITNNQLNRLSSVATDTCPTQASAWKKLHQLADFSGAFMVPCDSHGSQLIFKDFIEGKYADGRRYYIALFWEDLNAIVNHFHANKIEYAILRQLQRSISGQTRSLLQSGLTRWGTQINEAESVAKSESSLKTYAKDPRASDSDTAKAVKDILLAERFWDELKAALRVLRKVHEAVKMSESTHATLDKVFQRWLDIHDWLYNLLEPQNRGPFYEDIKDYLMSGKFGLRWNRQLHTIHTVAYLILPANRTQWRSIRLTEVHRENVLTFFENYGSGQGDQLQEQFFEYLEQRDRFNPQALCWKKTDPKLFWRLQVSNSSYLLSIYLH
jgi:hypothetical protein